MLTETAVVIDKDIFEKLKNGFLADLLKHFCGLMGRSVGLEIQVSDEQCEHVITQWKVDTMSWLAELENHHNKNEKISHLKESAILIYRLCEYEAISDIKCSEPIDELFDSLNEDQQFDRQVILDGGCAYVSWFFARYLCEYFENCRDDLSEPFSNRITEDFEHDMISLLHRSKLNQEGIWIGLKGVYARV